MTDLPLNNKLGKKLLQKPKYIGFKINKKNTENPIEHWTMDSSVRLKETQIANKHILKCSI